MKKRLFLYSMLVLVIMLLSACHTPTVKRGREDENIDKAAVSTTIDMADWRFALSKIVKKMQRSSFFNQGGRRTIAVADFLNESSEHLQTDILREMLEEEIINAGNFKLVDEKNRGKMIETMMKQSGASNIFDPTTVAAVGNQFGVQFFFQGKVLGQRERGYDKIRNQYLVSVEVVNVSTAEKVFKKTVPVTKQLQ